MPHYRFNPYSVRETLAADRIINNHKRDLRTITIGELIGRGFERLCVIAIYCLLAVAIVAMLHDLYTNALPGN